MSQITQLLVSHGGLFLFLTVYAGVYVVAGFIFHSQVPRLVPMLKEFGVIGVNPPTTR